MSENKEVRFFPEDFYLNKKEKGYIVVQADDKIKSSVGISVNDSWILLSYFEALELGKWLANHLNKVKP